MPYFAGKKSIMADQPTWQQRDPFGEKILLTRWDWRDARLLAWIDKFVEFGWRDSVKNVQRQNAIRTHQLVRSIKWRTWADSGGDRQVWQARYLYYAKFVELALGRRNPFRALPPEIGEPRWLPIQMPDRKRKAKPSIPTEMRRQGAKFVTMLEEKYSFHGIAMMAYALGPSIENKKLVRRLLFETKLSKVAREARA